MKKIIKTLIALILCMVFVFCVAGCGQEKNQTTSSDNSSVTSEEQKYYNPLTGLSGLDPQAVNTRPVAIMINNIKTAQGVQTGLNSADIVYEAYAEGGITRLMAVFKDIKKVGQIGSVRSARYSYVDLALGHDAVYIHAGMEGTYCTAHVAETGIDNFSLLNGKSGNYAFRQPNGLAYEHTLYTTGEKLAEGFKALNWRTELKTASQNWQNFVAEGESVTPNDGSCKEVSVTMSGSYITDFKYDAESGKYLRYSGSTARKDYKTGEQVKFKNVLVLKTTVTGFNDTIMKTGLDGGEGYYISNGGYVNIKWSKGNSSNPIKITLADGSACDYNAGNTWVCLVNKNNSVAITADTEN